MDAKRGGSLAQRREQAERTRNAVIEIVLEKPGITIKETADIIGIAPSSVSKALKYLRDNRLVYSEPYGRTTRIYPVEANSKSDVTTEPVTEPAKEPVTEPGIESKKEEKEVERYPEHKNDEGYNDFTAASTIKKLDDIFGTFAPGAVWTLSTAYGADAEYLVLRSYKGWVTGMMLQEDLQQYSPVYCVPVSMVDRKYVDCRRILTKPSKYFIEKKYDIPNFDRVKSKVCYLLAIEPEIIEKIVEKPVEVTKEVEVVKEVPVEVIKEVEKPVEVIKEVPVEVIKEVVKEVEVEKSVDAVDTALLRQKAEIYEKIAWQFLNTLSNVAEGVER